MQVAHGRQPAAIAVASSAKKLKVDARGAPAGLVRELASLVKDFPGEASVYVDLVRSMGSRVKPVPDFFDEVKALLGEAAVA